MFIRCRVTSRTILALCSTTKEEVEDLAVAMNKLFSITVDNRDTTHEIAPTPPLLVSIASPMIMLLKNVLFYKLSGRKRDHRWEIKMYS